MQQPPFALPPPVLNWIRDVFEQVNFRSSAKLTRIPTTWETSLDMTVIEQLSHFSAPFTFASDWVVRLDTHYLGGGRYWGRWEIADLGLLVIFRRKREIVATKVALLQSKRLYPDEAETDAEDHKIDYMTGFGRLLNSESEYLSLVKPRVFRFTAQSCYRALEYAGDQYEAILQYATATRIPVYYLLYNPLDLPIRTALPASAEAEEDLPNLQVGCRVIRADLVHSKLQAHGLNKSRNPSFEQLAGGDEHPFNDDFVPLQNFVTTAVLGCREGYFAGTNPQQDQGLFRVFNQRSGPISAAISITVDAP